MNELRGLSSRRVAQMAFIIGCLITLLACSSTNPENPDAAAASDSGNARDAASPDSEGDRDATIQDAAADASGPDSGNVNTCVAVFAGCVHFTDSATVASTRTIEFGVAGGRRYSPKCLQVTAGQAVTWRGDFTRHPLIESCGPDAVIADGSGGTASATLSAGLYGYYCGNHGSPRGTGMAGAILVVP
jgi:plastocyanin